MLQDYEGFMGEGLKQSQRTNLEERPDKAFVKLSALIYHRDVRLTLARLPIFQTVGNT